MDFEEPTIWSRVFGRNGPLGRGGLYDNIFRSLFPARSQNETVNGLVINRSKKEKEGYIESDFDLKRYRSIFNLSLENLRGKTILDIGCGRKETFSKEASEIGATVYSITPAYGERGFPGWLARRRASKNYLFFEDPKWQKRSVAARVQQLPFKDESFDCVLSNFAFTIYVKEREEQFLCVKEMVRVLKPAGLVMLHPFNSHTMTYEGYTIEGNIGKETVKWLRENNWDKFYRDTLYSPPIVIGKKAAVKTWYKNRS